MRVGDPSPQWAKDLVYKWIELDDKFYGLIHNVFVFYTDSLPSGPNTEQIRVFAEQEASARQDVLGKRDLGMFATYIEQDGFKVIDTPPGLEEWTENFINTKMSVEKLKKRV